MNTTFSRLATLTAAAVLLGVSTTVPAQTDDHAAHHPDQAEAAPEMGPGMGRSMIGGMQGMMDPEMMQGMMGRGMMRRQGEQSDMMERGMMPGPMMQGMMGMQGCGMMHGMMGHAMGPMGGLAMLHGLDPIGMLELDAEQHTEIRRMHSELRREHWDTLGQLLDERETLQELYAAESRDPAAIGEAHERLFALKRPLIEAMVDAGNRIEALLSEEQRKQLQQLRRHGRGAMGGMGMMGK